MSQALQEIAGGLERYSGGVGAALTVAIFALGYVLERRSRAITRMGAWHQYRSEIRQFADAAIMVMSEAEALCEAKPEILQGEFWNRYNSLLARLSALRDQGKLLIPNATPDVYGSDKAGAYRGLRERALDCLAAGFHIASAIDYSASSYNRAPTMLFPTSRDAQGGREVLNLNQESPRCDSPQVLKLRKGLEKLPGGYKEMGPFGEGWSCKSALVEAKRQFVSEAQDLIEARKWLGLIRKLAP